MTTPRDAPGLKDARCAFCLTDIDSAQLTPIAQLPVCPRCAAGELDAAHAEHGFTEEHKERHTKSSGTGGGDWIRHVEVARATPLEIIVTFRAEKGSGGWFSRLFSRSDTQVGHDEFDKRIRIKTDIEYEPTVEFLLQSAGAREALLHLIASGCSASIVGTLVGAGASRYNPDNLPAMEDIRVHAMALAIHVERFARESPF